MPDSHDNHGPKNSTYRAAARRLREFADQLDARAEAKSPQERRALTLAVRRLLEYARGLSARHDRRVQRQSTGRDSE